MEGNKFRAALFMLPLLTQGGGAEKYFINLARNFRERGIETDVVTMDENFFRKFARLLHIFVLGNFFGKINILGRENEKTVISQLGSAGWLRVSRKNLRNTLSEYDLVYSKNEIVDLFLLRWVGYKNLPPVIVGVHTPLFFPKAHSLATKFHNFLYGGFIYKWLLKGARCVHVSNKFTENLIEDKFNIKSKLIYYPFSVKAVADLARKETSGISFDVGKRNIVFVGRVGEQKGVDILISIIERAGKDPSLRNRIDLNIFGSGDERYEVILKNLAGKYSFIRYFGHIENRFIPSILSQQDLMIFPSRWETLPYSVLEAQSLGVPVVAFDIPGPSDIIVDGETGFLVRSEKEFFKRMKGVIEGKVNFDKKAIIQDIREKFDPERIYPQLVEMFQSVLCEN